MRSKAKIQPISNLLFLLFIQVLVSECASGMELADKVNLLHQEAQKGNDTAVRILLEDVDPDARLTKGGVTPLYRAASAGHRNTMHVLFLAGAQVNAEVTDPNMDLEGAPYDLLRYAIRSGDVTAVENFLAAGANLNEISAKWRYTPLHDAVEKNRFEITRILLKSNANVNADSINGPALAIAARNGHKEMITLLLKYGADIDGAGTKKPPLIEAVRAWKQSAALQLIELGANLNATSESGDYAIHIAVRNGLNQLTRHLIGKGLVNQRNKEGRTPLHVVQYLETALILCDGGALVNAVTWKGETPLHHATYLGNDDVVEVLVNKGANLGLLSNETYDMKEPFEGHEQLLRLLFRNHQRKNGMSIKGFSALAIAIWMKNNKIITYLIKKKSPLNVNGLEWPPLHMAAYIGEVKVIRELVEAGAQVDVRDIIGWTALHKAALKGSQEAVECLVQLGAQLDAKDQYGRSPLHLAAESGSFYIAKFLINSGADTNAADVAGFNVLAWAVAGGHPYFLRFIMDKESDMDSTSRYNYMRTFARGDIDAIINITVTYKKYMHRFDEGALREFLIKEIQDINNNITDIRRRLDEYARDKDRPLTLENIRTIIESAFQDRRKLYLEMVEYIANKTSNLNAQDSILGWSVLHWAAAAGDIDVAKSLVKRGAFINAESKLGQTPMYLARRWGHKDLYRFFKDIGAVW